MCIWCRLRSIVITRVAAGAGQFAAIALSGLSVIVYGGFQPVSHRSNVSLFVLGRCGHYTKPLQDSLSTLTTLLQPKASLCAYVATVLVP
jgi:hypothetical protein